MADSSGPDDYREENMAENNKCGHQLLLLKHIELSGNNC